MEASGQADGGVSPSIPLPRGLSAESILSMRTFLPLLTVSLFVAAPLFAADPPPASGDAMLKDYFARQVAEIENTQKLPTPASPEEWEKTRIQWRAELADMLGLNPMPERTPLNAVKTGEVEGDGYVVENLHFQSMPGLYVTANFYRPAKIDHPLPAILYGCGHSDVKGQDGTSLGNKTYYQHHGEWFARHGYVCLVLDTVQLGEIRGEHHGTYSMGRWWWMARGYTPAGVEAWAGIRALDYLETRPEVDRSRIGMTGRSGGGAYSWWVSALDDRIKVAVPTAGITTLHNHVVDGTVEGHCDCMFMVNTRRWDYDKVAALIAPRPLLIANTDKDIIFPLDGVMTVYNHVRALYKALGAEGKIGLQIAEGPHKDTQPLNAGAFAWFERFLKGADPMALLDEPARKLLNPEVLRVFKGLPKDEINTHIDERFVKAAGSPPVPVDAAEFAKLSTGWMQDLRTQVFAGWPQEAPDLELRELANVEHEGLSLRAWQFTSQQPWRLPLCVVQRADLKPGEIEKVRVMVLDEADWNAFRRMLSARLPVLFGNGERQESDNAPFALLKEELLKAKVAFAFVAPRGIGPTAWTTKDTKKETHLLRRFYLLGQTLDGMRVWDIRRALAAVRTAGYSQPLQLAAARLMAGNALYASLFEDGVTDLALRSLPASHNTGPIYLNVLRYLDLPQALAMASARAKVHLLTPSAPPWSWSVKAPGIPGGHGALSIDVRAENADTPEKQLLQW